MIENAIKSMLAENMTKEKDAAAAARTAYVNGVKLGGPVAGIQEAANKAKLGHFGTHTFRHTYRSWLDAVGTTVAVQQKMMRHTDIRTTMNIYGDVVTDEMTTAGARVAQLAFQSIGAQAERMSS
jgi:integrase